MRAVILIKLMVVVMSATKNSSSKIQGLLIFLSRYRNRSDSAKFVATQRYLRNNFFSSPATYKHNGYYYINSGIRFMSENPGQIDDRKPAAAGSDVVKDDEEKKKKKKEEEVQTSSQKYSGLFTWGKWLLSSAVAIWLSFLQKGRRIQVYIEGGKVEEVAEVVDKVATETEKVCAHVAEKLPLLKEEALFVENVSTIAASDAQFTIHFVHKVEELKQDFQDLETMAEPLVDKIRQLDIENHK